MKFKLTLQGLFLSALFVLIPPSAALFGQSQIQTDPADPFSPYIFQVPKDFELIEGDIVMPADRVGSLSTYGDTSFWTSGNVYYEFDSNVTASHQTDMLNAMAEWEAVADVDFIARSSQSNYLHIQNSTQNSSSVGMVGGKQTVNIYNWSYRFIMAHELGHALGLWHEQSRADRDTYITIEWDRIKENKDHNFDKHTEASHYGPYDFDSVMHYGQCSFSTCATCSADPANCRTITVKSPWNTQWQSDIGQRDHFSTYDILTVSYIYPQNNWRFVNKWYTGSQYGTFLYPCRTINTAMSSIYVPTNSIIHIEPGYYGEGGTFTKAMTWKAARPGSVTIGD